MSSVKWHWSVRVVAGGGLGEFLGSVHVEMEIV